MLRITEIFKHREVNTSKLLAFGFEQVKEEYRNNFCILKEQFQMYITITKTGIQSIQVMDQDSQEEYVLVHAQDTSGAFVSSVVEACEEELKRIAENCFDYAVFKNEQAKEVITYINEIYKDQLEFLWKKSDSAIFRCKDNGKWYAAMLKVSNEKLGRVGKELMEIMDLRATPDEVLKMVDGVHYFPAYHMNKVHWYTICLDGSISTQELCQRIDDSYALAKNK